MENIGKTKFMAPVMAAVVVLLSLISTAHALAYGRMECLNAITIYCFDPDAVPYQFDYTACINAADESFITGDAPCSGDCGCTCEDQVTDALKRACIAYDLPFCENMCAQNYEKCVSDSARNSENLQEAHAWCDARKQAPTRPDETKLVRMFNNDYFTLRSIGMGAELVSPAADALLEVAKKLDTKLYFVSISRTWDQQVNLYENYEICLQGENPEDCAPTCDPGGNLPCPHTLNIAVDVWCDKGAGRIRDPQCQADLTKEMEAAGFCRLSTEAWHFEWNAMHTSLGCAMYTDSSYQRRDEDTGELGPTIDPTDGGKCKRWDYNNDICIKPSSTAMGSQTAAVKDISGDVKVKSLDGTTAPLASKTASIGDTIQTGDGTMGLGFGDGATVSVLPSTSVTVMDLDKQMGLLLDLTMGRLKTTITNHLESKLSKIRTPNVVMAERGTEFITEHLNGKTTIYLHEGEVDVTPLIEGGEGALPSVKLTAGHSIVVYGDGGVDISPMEEEKWLSQMNVSGNVISSEQATGCVTTADCPVNRSCTVAQCMAGSCVYYTMGCELSGSCVQKGEQRTVNGVLSYCAGETWNATLKGGKACTHDSECVSYACDNGKCGQSGPFGIFTGIIDEILNAIKGLFGLR